MSPFAGPHLRLREAAIAHRDAAPRHHLHLLHDRARRGAGGVGQDAEGVGAAQAPPDFAGIAGDERRRGGPLLVSPSDVGFRSAQLLDNMNPLHKD